MTAREILPRSWWEEPSRPVVGPAFPGWAAITDGVVWHYPGHDNVPRTSDEVRRRIRTTQRYYVSARGYSIGYGWKLDPFGRLIEVRGTTFRNAANSGKRVPTRNINHSTVSVQVMVDMAGHPTGAQLAAMPLVVEWLESQAGRPLDHRPHSHWDYTSCCGDPIRAWLAAGDIRPTPTPSETIMHTTHRRILDTRITPRKFTVDFGDASKAAALANVTIADAAGPCHISVAATPATSVANGDGAAASPNLAVLPLVGGKVELQLVGSAARVVVDLQGWAA